MNGDKRRKSLEGKADRFFTHHGDAENAEKNLTEDSQACDVAIRRLL